MSIGKIHAESLEGDDGVSDEEGSGNLDFNRAGGSDCQHPPMWGRCLRSLQLLLWHYWDDVSAFCSRAGSRNKYLIMYRIFHFHMYVWVMHMYMHVQMYVQGICMCMGMEAHQGRVFQSNQELQIWLVLRGNLPLGILYSCLSRLELLADYHACPTVMWILGIWIVNHTCREASSPLSHCYSSPHVDFPNTTEVRELRQTLYHP